MSDATNLNNIANTVTGAGNTILPAGEGQYMAGLEGKLTPAQQALTNFTLGQNQLRTNQGYANLGLGGSTMNAQDLNADKIQSLAQQEQIDFQNEQAGLAGVGAGAGLLGQGAGIYGNQEGMLANLYNQQNQNFLQSLGSAGQALGNKSAGSSSSGSGGLVPSLGSILGIGNTSAGAVGGGDPLGSGDPLGGLTTAAGDLALAGPGP